MAALNNPQTIERQQFFTGQRLFASDIQDIEALNRDMRWRHNQSLHSPGVGMGYHMDANVGDREVSVRPGYAIDAQGREMVLLHRQVLSVPAVADDGFGDPAYFDLALSYPDDRSLQEAESENQILWSNTAARLRDEPIFHWIALDHKLQPKDDSLKADIKNGMKIILKRLSVLNCRIKQIKTDIKIRQAQPEKPPYIFAGKSYPQWSFWQEGGKTIGLRAKVDTTCSKFNNAPQYFANVSGGRFVISEIAKYLNFIYYNDRTQNRFLLDGITHITRAENVPLESGFELRLLMPIALVVNSDGYLVVNPSDFFDNDINNINNVLNALRWHIIWVGVEGGVQ